MRIAHIKLTVATSRPFLAVSRTMLTGRYLRPRLVPKRPRRDCARVSAFDAGGSTGSASLASLTAPRALGYCDNSRSYCRRSPPVAARGAVACRASPTWPRQTPVCLGAGRPNHALVTVELVVVHQRRSCLNARTGLPASITSTTARRRCSRRRQVHPQNSEERGHEFAVMSSPPWPASTTWWETSETRELGSSVVRCWHGCRRA
jgi:hypothetical protein